jgi:hypothetical protein
MKVFELFESAILAEDKVEFLEKTSGKKLQDRALEDTGREMSANDVLKELLKADPTKKQDFMVYISNMYLKKQFKLEDVTRIKKELETFQKVKSKLTNKDISSYKTLDQLYDALEPFADASENDLKSNKALVKDAKSGAKYIINEPDFKVLVPKTKEAACFYGANTKWCTAADENNMFDHYNEGGNLYIIIAKDNGKDRKFQLHVEHDQFMDERDKEVSKADIKFLSSFDGYTKFLNMMIKKHYIDA